MTQPDFVYRDTDLYEVLCGATPDELGRLVEVLRYRKFGRDRVKESNRDPALIAFMLQLYGGNDLANLRRKHGVMYRQIVEDVGGHLGIDLKGAHTIADMEHRIACSLVEGFENMSTEESLASLAKASESELGEHYTWMPFAEAYTVTVPAVLVVAMMRIRQATAQGGAV